MVRQKAFVVLALGAVLTACSSGPGTSVRSSTTGGPSGQSERDAEIVGSYLFRDHETHQNPPGAADFEVTLNWDVRNVGKVFKLYGSVAAEGSGSMSSISCTGGLSPAPGVTADQVSRLISVYAPGDTSVPQSDVEIVGKRSQSPWKNDYLVIGGVPGLDAGHVFASGNTDPAETSCNTEGILFSASPSAGSTGSFYSSDHPAYAFYDQAGDAVAGSQERWHWQYDGPVDSAPGYQDTVTEKLCEEINFGPEGTAAPAGTGYGCLS